MTTHEVDGIQVRLDKDGMIGWMSDWGAIFELQWIERHIVEEIPHNSGGLGGCSYRLIGYQQVIRDFDMAHPFGRCTIRRDRDHLICATCDETVYAPVLPKPKPTPMEGSLSPWD